ncbi:MAG: spermidine synthase [Candidatus Rokuibacteriota bacterium]
MYHGREEDRQGRCQRTMILILYALTLFAGATLLFVVQPMVGKMVLPLLGGTPAVWSTCLVFFQAALLGGYAYAHASAAWLGVRRQARWHLILLVLPLAVLPLGVDATLLRGGETSPVLDVLLLLAVSVGLPFFVVSATAPLLQTWFTQTGHPAAHDPYFLYAASNLGSMLALLAYPTVIEPRLRLRDWGWLAQTHLWSVGYVVLALLIVLCALTLPRVASVPSQAVPEAIREITSTQRLAWIALAFVPSSLLLGVTTYITTDIASVPFLWVLPLAVYLLSFILAFGRYPPWLHRAVGAATLPVILAVLFLVVSGFRQRIWISVLWHMFLLLVVALACHGELARGRPEPARLTEFYLLISVGGALGGLVNALIAPAVFNSLAEYPLVMALACVLMGRPHLRSGGTGRARLVDVTLGLGTGVLALVLYSDTLTLRIDFTFLSRLLRLTAGGATGWLDTLEQALNKLVVYAPPLVLAFLWRRRPLALGVALVSVLVVAGFVESRNIEQIRQARSFFGVLRVTRDRHEKGYTELRHGTTLHGRQSLEAKRRGEPLSYYHRQGPMGQLFAEFDRRATLRRIAVIGLGTGTLAAYAQPGDTMVFYEIDGLVRTIALDRAYFTYLSDARARGATVRIELGDARVRLETIRQEWPGERYDLIVVDAFSSDAVPVHLLTRQAFQLYFEMLTPRGLLALHLSNRYLDLERVAANLAEDAGLGGRLLQHDEATETEGATRSTWAVLTRTSEALGDLALDERWTATKLEVDPRVGVWTDDFHNLLSVIRW